METTANERLVNVVDYLREHDLVYNDADFCRKIGTNRSFLSDLKSGRRVVSKQTALKVSETFPVISYDWLFDGVGEMIVESPLNASIISSRDNGVPAYDVDFMGGFDLIAPDNHVNPVFYVDFPPYNDADAWIRVSGSSMEPVISSGDYVALKKVPDWKTYILYGEVYGIITDSYRTIKKVRRSANGDDYVRLVPVNPDYDEQDIPVSIIVVLFKVLGTVKTIN